MDIESCQEHIRKAILAISPVHEKALIDLQKLFIYEKINANEFFCKAGDYSLYFAYVCKGFFRSYYRDPHEKEHCTSIFAKSMFMLPLPSFLYRKPTFQFFQAIQESIIIKIKYAEIENFSRKESSVNDFLRALIDREWIIKKELSLSGKYIYNHRTRYNLFHEQFQDQVSSIPIEYISSYLSIPEKQLKKLME